MKVHEIMTAHARCVGPENMLVEAAGLMRELDVGALPVCDDDRLAGMVTDRDITLRGVADGRDPNTTPIRDVMSKGIMYVFADQEVEDVARVMEERQIRRVPVLNREKRLVGIVSLGDIAISSHPAFSGMALRDVSEPRNPTARQRRLAERSTPPPKPPASRAAERRGGERKESERPTPRRSTAKRKTSKAKSKTTRSTSSTGRSRKGAARRSTGKSSSARSRPRRTAERAAG
jgi:CBS domain-containing protein